MRGKTGADREISVNTYTGGFTTMLNHHLRNRNLSLKAVGLLSKMLSLPPDWDYSIRGLAMLNTDGIDGIRTAMKELEDEGYVVRVQSRDERGRMSRNKYTVYALPQKEKPSPDLPSSENPTTEYPAAGGTAAEKSTQIIKERRKKEQQRTDSRKKESLPIPSTPFPGTMDAKGRKRSRERPVDHQEMDAYRSLIRENIRYEDFVQERPWDVGQLDEMVELMVETVCSNRENVRVCGNDLPQAVVKSRLLKLDGSHIRYVFECLKDNTTHIRNIRQYLLTALYNAPATMENYYAAQVNHDLYGVAA